MANSISSLSTFTGLSETELAKRAQEMVDGSGKIRGLSALDAALVAASAGGAPQGGSAVLDAAAAATYVPHTMEEPIHTVNYPSSGNGVASDNVSPMAPVTPEVLDRAAKNVVKRMQALATPVAASGITGATVTGGAGAKPTVTGSAATDTSTGSPVDGGGGSSSFQPDSSNLMFEQLKLQVQRQSEIHNAITNVLSAMHGQAMEAVRNVKA